MQQTRSILPLRIQGLGFAVGGQALVDHITFDLPKGGVTGIIGPNGAGKSLTLRLCHGLIAPTSGTLRWEANGGVIDRHKRHAMVFQRPVMLRRSVLANMTHALSAAGRNTPGRADAALERCGLAHLADRPARLLSGGEQQRLAITRAAALEPEVLFLDEPTAHLDPGATRQIEALIMGLAGEGITIMLSTHDLAQARRLCQRVLFLNRGRLLEDKPAEAFFTAPATAEGRAFIGGELLW